MHSYDEETAREMDAISNMIKHSEEEGLLTEVIASLVRELAPNITTDNLAMKCQIAMNEWDV